MPKSLLLPAPEPESRDSYHVRHFRHRSLPITHEKKGLAPGALAGIAVGGCALFLALGAGMFLFLRRRKRARRPYNSPGSSNSATTRFEPLRTGT